MNIQGFKTIIFVSKLENKKSVCLRYNDKNKHCFSNILPPSLTGNKIYEKYYPKPLSLTTLDDKYTQWCIIVYYNYQKKIIKLWYNYDKN